MERLRILTAAVALSEFTVSELSTYSGANQNTVRSVLHRNPELIQPLSTPEQTGAGRPRKRYKVRDVEAIRSELRQLEQSVEAFGTTHLSELTPETADDRIAAVFIAESTILRAWNADASGEERRVLGETALESAMQASPAASEWSLPAEDELSGRAQGAAILADLAVRETNLSPHDLEQAANSLARLADVLAPARTQNLLAAFSQAAIESHQLPPIGLLTDIRKTPANTLSAFAPDDSMWKGNPLSSGGEVVWCQRWAHTLLDRQLIAGLVIPCLEDSNLDTCLGYVKDWRVPRLVVGDAGRIDLVTLAGMRGALFLPSSAEPKMIADALLCSAYNHVYRAALQMPHTPAVPSPNLALPAGARYTADDIEKATDDIRRRRQVMAVT